MDSPKLNFALTEFDEVRIIYLPGSEAMYACIHESWAGFFERVCTLSATTANFRDPPPPRYAKEPEPWQ
jgi:hypothetical protein